MHGASSVDSRNARKTPQCKKCPVIVTRIDPKCNQEEKAKTEYKKKEFFVKYLNGV